MGNWYETIGPSELLGGAGTDVSPTIESSAYAGSIDIGNTGGSSWTLLVNRSGASLPDGVTLAVRRNGSGSCGTLVGGLDYQNVSDQSQSLFNGTGDCTGISIQLRLHGLSIQQGPGLYGTTVLYSLVQ